MKAPASAQRLLLDVADLDAEISRQRHRRSRLPEQVELDRLAAETQDRRDDAVAADMVVEDVDRDLTRVEGEVDSLRRREDKDGAQLAAGGLPPKQLTELEHELAGLRRRRDVLEDQQLELMERREEAAAVAAEAQSRVDALTARVAEAQMAVGRALEGIDLAEQTAATRRVELISQLPAELAARYERLRSRGGIGAGLLRARRCGACRVELDRGTVERIAAAADDEVATCEECGAILVRTHESGLTPVVRAE